MKPLVLLSTVALCLAPAFSVAEEMSVTAELAVGSKYVFRGIQLGDDTLHPSIEFNQGDFYGGAWGALPLENKGWPESFVDEYDFYAGYGWALGEHTAMDVGGTYYHYPDVGGSTFEGFVGISREMGSFTPSFYVYNDFDLDTVTLELATDVVLPLESMPFEATLFVGRVEAKGGGDYSYFGADLVYPVEINQSTNLSLGLHYSDNDVGFGVPDEHVYGTASVAVDF